MADLPSGTSSSRPRPAARPFVGPANAAPVPPAANVSGGPRPIGAPFAPKMRQIGPEVTPSSDLSTASVLVPSDSEQLQAQTHRIDEEIDERPSTSYQPEVQQLIA